MWSEKIIKMIPAVLLLFCLLQIFELLLIISNMNKTEKLEAKVESNLKMLEHIVILLNEHSSCMDLAKDKRVKVK
ncbi:hypothetical protein ACMWP2_03845 [Helicobacter pylori]